MTGKNLIRKLQAKITDVMPSTFYTFINRIVTTASFQTCTKCVGRPYLNDNLFPFPSQINLYKHTCTDKLRHVPTCNLH